MCLLKDSGLEYTFIRVGEVVEGKEGGSVMVGNVTDELPMEQVVRDDVVRLSAEAFMMENATNTVRCCNPVNPVVVVHCISNRQHKIAPPSWTHQNLSCSGMFHEFTLLVVTRALRRGMDTVCIPLHIAASLDNCRYLTARCHSRCSKATVPSERSDVVRTG